jgi:tRNA dimethylallyltransferase
MDKNKDSREKPLVLFLVGPTACGKSDAAIELAQKIDAEIISADSMQVYRKMDILSAKPELKQQKTIPHHLIDILNPTQEYNVAVFREKALKCIEDIVERKKTPLVVGGTGLYVKAIIHGIFSDGQKDEQLRKDLAKQAKHHGNEFLYARLKKADLEAALKIHPNDLRRIIRALEVYELNGQAISDRQTQVQGLDEDYRYKIFAIQRERKELYQRIEKRVDLMFDQGLIDEVKSLLGLELSHTAAQALGIKQLKGYFDKEYDLDHVKQLIKRDSRRFAKRQLTWFRAQKEIIWLPADAQTTAGQIAEEIISLLSL